MVYCGKPSYAVEANKEVLWIANHLKQPECLYQYVRTVDKLR
jgi:hypothetical protein